VQNVIPTFYIMLLLSCDLPPASVVLLDRYSYTVSSPMASSWYSLAKYSSFDLYAYTGVWRIHSLEQSLGTSYNLLEYCQKTRVHFWWRNSSHTHCTLTFTFT